MENHLNIGDLAIIDNAKLPYHRIYRGEIIDVMYPYTCPYTGSLEPGHITIETECGRVHTDYYTAFEPDRERIREMRLKELGI